MTGLRIALADADHKRGPLDSDTATAPGAASGDVAQPAPAFPASS